MTQKQDETQKRFELHMIPPPEKLGPEEAIGWLAAEPAGYLEILHMGLEIREEKTCEALGRITMDIEVMLRACAAALEGVDPSTHPASPQLRRQ